jgi:hypothetical protein
MDDQPTSYYSPKLEGKVRAPGDRGLFAREPIQAGEMLTVWGGEICTYDALVRLSPEQRRLSVQVEEGLYLVSTHDGPGDWVNHSCDPNAGLNGQIVLVALRDILPGEEICFDYAMTDGSPYDQFDCRCGSPDCRCRITGDDWRSPALWHRYNGYFSPYLQRRINRLRSTTTTVRDHHRLVAEGAWAEGR